MCSLKSHISLFQCISPFRTCTFTCSHDCHPFINFFKLLIQRERERNQQINNVATVLTFPCRPYIYGRSLVPAGRRDLDHKEESR